LRGSDGRSRTNEDLGFSSQEAKREGDQDGESPLRRGNPRDDLGDEGPHEAVIFKFVSW